MRLLQNTLIGAMVGLFSGYVIETGVHTTKTFAFIWAAPILLFIPLYISYYKGPLYASDFLSHAFLGSFLSVCVILITLIVMHFHLWLALALNFILSNGIIMWYISKNT